MVLGYHSHPDLHQDICCSQENHQGMHALELPVAIADAVL